MLPNGCYLNDEDEGEGEFIDIQNDDIKNDDSLDTFQDYLYESEAVDAFIHHKSNLVNSVLNNKTKISSDRIIRVQMRNPTDRDNFEGYNSIVKLTDTIATIVSFKKKQRFRNYIYSSR